MTIKGPSPLRIQRRKLNTKANIWKYWSNQDQRKLDLPLIRSRRALTYILAASLSCGQKPAEQLHSCRGKGILTHWARHYRESSLPDTVLGLLRSLGFSSQLFLLLPSENQAWKTSALLHQLHIGKCDRTQFGFPEGREGSPAKTKLQGLESRAALAQAGICWDARSDHWIRTRTWSTCRGDNSKNVLLP